MIYTIGIDPGTVTGWAFAVTDIAGGARIFAHGSTGRPRHPTTGADVMRVLKEVLTAAPGAVPLTIVGERPFIPGQAGRHGKERAHALGAMVVQAALYRWIGVAESIGCEVYRHRDGREGVPPGIWRADQWGPGKWTTERAKRTAVKRAAALFDVELPLKQHHTAEACFIAVYGGLEIRKRRREAQKKGRNQ